jgi:monolysocardiolipin acyltransferase
LILYQQKGDRAGRPLITVANHISTLDDPGMWGFLKLRHFVDIGRQRWTLIAEDICNQKLRHSIFFGLAQGIPVHRGSGVYQPVSGQ